MDLNDLCITLILVNCVWLLVMRPAQLWVIKIVAVLGLLGSVWLWRPDRAGYYAVGPWAFSMGRCFLCSNAVSHWRAGCPRC